MLRRASLPTLGFGNSKRDRRLSTPSSQLPVPSRPSTRGFVKVKVADFVTVPPQRLSEPRNALGPVDLVNRPPCYDLRPAPRSAHALHEAPDHVFEIPDREHIDRLRSILTSYTDSGSEHSDSQREDSSLPQTQHRDDSSDKEHNTEDQPSGDPVDKPLKHQLSANSETVLSSDSKQQLDDSDAGLTDRYDDLRELDDASDVEQPTDPDLDFDKDATTTSQVLASLAEEATITSIVLSTSSVADTSLSEFPTITSINTIDATSESPSSVTLEDAVPSVFVTVESTEGPVVAKKQALPSFMRKKVPSPVKYTFRPLHKVPSRIEDRPESSQVTTIIPAKCPARRKEHVPGNSDSASDSSSHEEAPSPKSPTLEAVKSIVDKLDPHLALSIANVPPLALATVGFFRKKRDSEDSFRSKKSDASNRKKRESDESTRSSNTEYYEDDYTKFIEKKSNFPLSPLRLRNHPYFAKIVSSDDGLRFSWSGRRSSSLSVSTSDEEYIPLSSVTESSDAS